MSFTVINDLLLYNRPQLSQIARNHCLRRCVICCHSDISSPQLDLPVTLK